MKKTILLLVLSVLLYGCSDSTKERLSCNLDSTKHRLSNYYSQYITDSVHLAGGPDKLAIYIENSLLVNKGITDISVNLNQLNQINYDIKNIRSEQISDSSSTCSADLIAKHSLNEVVLPIQYKIDLLLDSKNDVYITSTVLSESNIFSILSLLISSNKTLTSKKMISGEIFVSSLDSDFGEYGFITNSSVGSQIFAECGFGDFCEAEADIDKDNFIEKIYSIKRLRSSENN